MVYRTERRQAAVFVLLTSMDRLCNTCIIDKYLGSTHHRRDRRGMFDYDRTLASQRNYPPSPTHMQISYA